MRRLASRFVLLHVQAIFSCFAVMLMHGVIECVCPCPPIDAGRAFVPCDVLSQSIDTDQLRVQGTACFQGPVQLCSGASGLPNPVLEGLWAIALQGQPVGPGESALQTIGRTRSVDCTGTILTIDFHQQTADPADAFTLLKTIQAGDTLQFTRINPSSCEVEQAVSACAASGVAECGPVLTVSVFNASGLVPLYTTDLDDYVSLLNFGPKSSDSIQLSQQQECTNCSSPMCPDPLCWPSQVCSGLTAGFIPPECSGLSGAAEQILVNAACLDAVTIVAVPKTTLGGCLVVDSLCATRIGDRLRLYTPGIADKTPLNTPPGQLGWSTSLLEPFGAVGGLGDGARALAIDLDGNTILAGFHDFPTLRPLFAALQIIPDTLGGVGLGWATALSGPFGPTRADQANGVAITASGDAILAGSHDPTGAGPLRFAALQLIPDLSGGIDLGWATAPVEPFGVSMGDEANAVVIAGDGSIILAGCHTPLTIDRFAALQLIPSGTSVQLGWATAPVEPFGPSLVDRAHAVAIDSNGNIILAGFHAPASSGLIRFAALQLVPVGTGIQLGWATAPNEPFGPVTFVGDVAYGVVVDCNDNVILAGAHEAPDGRRRMAALQLIPNGTSVSLGWATALSGPFGSVALGGDEARGVAIDDNNNIILGGIHSPSGVPQQFAALQLIPNSLGGVDLGWLTAVVPGNFEPSEFVASLAVAIDQKNNVILGGINDPVTAIRRQFAALQLRQSFVPLYGDYEITGISEVDNFVLFELALINTEGGTVRSGQELCVRNFGFCCA